jgi:putative DNA primase/helicase
VDLLAAAFRNGKHTKAPVNPHTGQLASVRDSTIWSSFARAKEGRKHFRCEGLGFVLNGDGLVAIDLDDCVTWNGESFKIDPRANVAILAMNAYTDFSPSRTGVHIFAFGALPERGRRNDAAHFEIYSDRQFLTVTGDVVPGTAPLIENRSRELCVLYQQFFGTSHSTSTRNLGRGYVREPRSKPRNEYAENIDDDVLLNCARTAQNGALFRALFDDGDVSRYEGDHSRADFALCCLLRQRAGRFYSPEPLPKTKTTERSFRSKTTSLLSLKLLAIRSTKDNSRGRASRISQPTGS